MDLQCAKVVFFSSAGLISLFMIVFIGNESENDSISGNLSIGPSVRYVSLCNARLRGNHRTGNHLFMLSAMIFVANVTNRRVAMPNQGWNLDDGFDIDVTRVSNLEKELCPCHTIHTPHYDFEKSFLNRQFLESLLSSKRTILLCGLSQSFRYPYAVAETIRNTVRFKLNVSHEADSFLNSTVIKLHPISKLQMNSTFSSSPHSTTSHLNDTAVINNRVHRVGVHVRRGDFQSKGSTDYGLTVADQAYLKRAFDYYKQRHPFVQFIVTSDDFNWTLNNIPQTDFASQVVVSNHSGAVDLAILSRCDSLIISTGSYSWWAAWLANKTTVYYNDWPRKGSHMSNLFNRSNYFPPEWIGL